MHLGLLSLQFRRFGCGGGRWTEWGGGTGSSKKREAVKSLIWRKKGTN